jgi:hypothetical protein
MSNIPSLADIQAKMEEAKKELNQKVKPNKSKVLHTDVSSAPKLSISGKLSEKNHDYIYKNLKLLKSQYEEMKTLCKGPDLCLLNYLISLGLQKVNENKSTVFLDYSEHEDKHSSGKQ